MVASQARLQVGHSYFHTVGVPFGLVQNKLPSPFRQKGHRGLGTARSMGTTLHHLLPRTRFNLATEVIFAAA